MSTNLKEVVWVKNARLAFAKGLFKKEPPANDPNGRAKYSISLILAPNNPDLQKIREIQERLVLETEWKDKTPAKEVLAYLTKKDMLAVHDGNDKRKFEGFEGNFYISASADNKPTAANLRGQEVTEQDGVFYSGCYVNAKIEIWVMDNKWGKRVNVAILGAQFVRDGDSFGGGAPPARPDEFPDLDAGGDSEDDALFA